MNECAVEGCAKTRKAHGLCPMHVQRMQKHGDPLFINPIRGRPLKGEHPTFGAIHKRLSRQRGPAREHVCVDCGGTAAEWSYQGGCLNELRGSARGSIVPYSENLSLYAPRCVRCHRIFDGAGEGRVRNSSGQFIGHADGDFTPGVTVTVTEVE